MLISTLLVFAALIRILTSPFKGNKSAANYFKDVIFAMTRSQLGNMTLAQERYINSLTTPVYISFAKDKGFPPDSITLSDGVQAHWIGNNNAQKTIVYFHGSYNHLLHNIV